MQISIISSLITLTFICVINKYACAHSSNTGNDAAMTSSRQSRDLRNNPSFTDRERERLKEQRRIDREGGSGNTRRGGGRNKSKSKSARNNRNKAARTTPNPSERNYDEAPPPAVIEPEVERTQAEIEIYPNATEGTPMCPSCQMREHRRLLRIQMIKEDLLRKLKLDAPPVVNRTRNMTMLPDYISMDPHEPAHQHNADGFKNLIFGEPREFMIIY